MEKETGHMNMQLISRRERAPLAAISATLFFLAASSPATASPSEGMLFTGAGYGPTRDYAIQAAIWDAEASAGAYQFYTCKLIGEPRIFPGPNPEWHRNFSAEADVFCSP
jgi:hypothetical protein